MNPFHFEIDETFTNSRFCFIFRLQELYRIIASHAKLIGACTRSLSRQRDSSETPTSKIELEPQPQHQSLQNDEDNCFSSLETHTTRRSHSSSNSNSECNLKALERRYHSLYLKSFEISLLFENLLAYKNDDLQVCFGLNFLFRNSFHNVICFLFAILNHAHAPTRMNS